MFPSNFRGCRALPALVLVLLIAAVADVPARGQEEEPPPKADEGLKKDAVPGMNGRSPTWPSSGPSGRWSASSAPSTASSWLSRNWADRDERTPSFPCVCHFGVAGRAHRRDVRALRGRLAHGGPAAHRGLPH